MRMWLILLWGISLVACSQQNAAQPPAPEVVLQAIPAADSAKFERIHDMKTWRNPYLIVRPAGAAVAASNWPYGRVVAAAENTTKPSDQDGVAIRRTKGIVGGILESAHIAVKWVPSA